MGPQMAKAGRPRAFTEPVKVRLPQDLLSGIDKYSAEMLDAPGRAETVRRIVRDWLIGHGYLSMESGDGDDGDAGG